MVFTHLAELLPEIEEASEIFETALQTAKSNDDLEVAAARYNKILLKAVEAIYQDTKHVNSRETIFSVFAKVHEGGLTYFSNNPYLRLKKAVESGSISHI